MNPNPIPTTSQDCSSLKIEILIEESWIDNYLSNLKVVIPINEQYSLTNLKINLGVGTLNFTANLQDKESSSVEINSRPEWDATNQRILITDLKLKTDSNNLFLKSAGWFAQTFMGSKIDRKIEEQANIMLQKQFEKLKEKPIEIPVPKGGVAKIMISSLHIDELLFVYQGIEVMATVNTYLKVHLLVDA